MRVVLVVPPLRAFNNRQLPLGLMSIAASLRAKRPDDQIFIVDECVPDDSPFSKDSIDIVSQRILNKVLSINPDLVGLTCTTADFWHVLNLANGIKNNKREITTVVGGAHPTLCPEEFFTHSSSVDYVCVGEGEKVFPEFVAALAGVNQFPEKGVWRKVGPDIQKALPSDFIKNLDEIPFPAYDLIDMERYVYPTDSNIRPLLLSSVRIFSSRGCPYACRFCSSFSVWGRSVRYRNPSKVVDEIEMLRDRWNFDGFFFSDETFTLNKEHAKSVCSELMKRNINMPWGCQTRVNHVDEELYETMKRAGCVQLEFGVEAGNERGWKALNKQITREQVVHAFSLARKNKFRTLANFMVNIPGETEQDIKDIQSLIKEIKPTTCVTNIMTPYPGTSIADERGGIPADDYEKLIVTDSKRWLEFLDEKWRFASHDIPMETAARSVSAAARMISLRTMIGIFDSIYDWNHVKTMFRSRWKYTYLKKYFQITGNRLAHLCKQGIIYGKYKSTKWFKR